MTARANNYSLAWDFVIPESLTGTQKWVLTAMKSHGEGLIVMLWRILANEDDVCDAYQDTFLKLAHYHGGQKPENVKAYLFRSASNTAISILRRRKIQRKFTTEISHYQREIISPSQELDSKQLQERLRDGIAHLPDALREIVILRDMAELSYEQVGKILGISTATARVYRCKAIGQLAIWLEKESNDE
ncbi:MAG: RNA polymerase sigma factor [Planctomycetota bacterium]|jgi:RNA polymerase sigma factor (sigma-70 family)